MLRNSLDALETHSRRFKHVTLLQGAKAYGMHLGRVDEPAKETDPRVMPPNWYYDQEDLLLERCKAKDWSWTIFRPVGVFGFAAASPINVMTCLGVYIAISKHLKLPLRYPGSEAGFRNIRNAVDADLVAEAILWAADNANCRGQVFNVGNGDLYSWRRLWPRVARLFDMETAPPMVLPLSALMPYHEAAWAQLRSQHGLAFGLRELTQGAWPIAEAHFNMEFGGLQDTLKLRKFGFHEFCDTEEMIERKLREMMSDKILPN
jgi:nucleoside-diphosphate-sugar epimerase